MALRSPVRSVLLQRLAQRRGRSPLRSVPRFTARASAFKPRFARLSRYRVRSAQGGFFKDVFKGVKKVVGTVAKIPVVGQLAKVAVGGIPVLGGVVSAVNAVKAAVRPPTTTQAAVMATPLGVAATQPVGARPPSGGRRRRKASRPRRAKAKRARSGKRGKGGGTAKQRAARARFARAARKGRIKKGQRLG